jgi:hypothetical protein
MKKVIITLAVLVMAFGNVGFAQREAHLKSDATANMLKYFGVRTETSVVPQQAWWEDTYGTNYRTTYFYDEDELYLAEEVSEMDDGDGWYNTSRLQYEYGFSGNVIEMLYQEWDGADWVDAARGSFEYDGDLLSEVIYQVDYGTGWVNYMKEVYNYNGDESTILYWEWNGTTWSSSELYTYTYGPGSIELIIQYMQGGAWQYDQRQLITLNFEEKIEEVILQEWTGASWENYERTTYNYEGGVYPSKDIDLWSESEWYTDYRFIYEYDSDGNAKHGECYYYGGGDEGEPADNDIEMAYDYSAESNEYFGWRAEVSYIDLTGVNEGAQAASFLVYPVPAQGEIFIEADNFAKAEIYSLTGQKLMESLRDRMNVSNLSSGLYVMKVYDREGGCATQRFVVK